ncbi:hypothetical protein ACEN8I_05810 [Polaromonas sp. CT11-55]|uniref:hypothetical protein n=1 Tax=Polaromonas sp. CT11-55 TaxID=3243045 RepID=UPI0039A733A3
MVWQILGIDPTHDVITIKKAYAAKLKFTRPDDDPIAYQRLREAYEHALDHAKAVVSTDYPGAELALHPTNIPTSGNVDVAPFTDEWALGATRADPSEDTGFETDFSSPIKPHESQAQGADEHFEHPRDIVKRVAERLHYQDSGENWATVQAELDRLPLSLLPEANRLCAQFVIDTDDLSLEFVEGFTDYFGWGSDFRSAQMLGSKRNLELEERLNRWDGSFARKTEVRQRYAEVLSFGLLAQQPSSFRLYFLMTLAAGKVSRLWAELTQQQRLVLGFSLKQGVRFNRAVNFAGWLRILVIAALCLALQRLNTYPTSNWITGVLLFCIIGAGLSLAYDSGSRWEADAVENAAAKQRMYPATKHDWFLPVWMFIGTFVCLIVEQDFRSVSPVEGTTRDLVICGVVLFFSLPLIAFLGNAIPLTVRPKMGATGSMLAVLALCVAGANSLPEVNELHWTGVCLGITWFLFTRLAYVGYGSRIEARWLAISENIKQQRLLGNTKGWDEVYPKLLLAVRLTLGFPYLLMHLAARQSARLVIAISILTLVAVPYRSNDWRVPISMAIAGLFVLTHDLYAGFAVRALTGLRTDAWKERLKISAFTAWLVWVLLYMRATPAILGAIHIRTPGNGLTSVWTDILFTVLLPSLVATLVWRIASTLAPWGRVLNLKVLNPVINYLCRVYDKNRKSR